ncbi:MAG: DUF2147 domain-containing protein [Bacteroidales bacterium]|jgi:uncharacterized protein (DUF2147 family)|nr:DUF2147 domain-containing protein [Bacteroidales bacterium]
MKKTTKELIFTLLMISSSFLYAQSIVGKWQTVDDNTGKPKAIVEIYQKEDKYYGKIVELLYFPTNDHDPICTPCKDYRKNMKVKGMEIITGVKYDAKSKEYKDGKILDPEKGESYTCKLWIDNEGNLKVRGYVAMFYRTQTWKKEK